MLKKIKYVSIALLLLVTGAEVMTFAYSAIAEHKAEALTELLTSLKPGYTKMDEAKALFQAHGVDVDTLSNACNTPRGPCDELNLGAGNYRYLFFRRDPPLGFELFPFPPFKRASFVVDLFFINGILDSINSVYRVGTTDVKYSRGAGNYQVRISKWRYSNGGKVTSIAVSSSEAALDEPFPHFALNYMYSVKSPDARELWPTAPPPTTESGQGR